MLDPTFREAATFTASATTTIHSTNTFSFHMLNPTFTDLDVWRPAWDHPLLPRGPHLSAAAPVWVRQWPGLSPAQLPACGSCVDGRVQGEERHVCGKTKFSVARLFRFLCQPFPKATKETSWVPVRGVLGWWYRGRVKLPLGSTSTQGDAQNSFESLVELVCLGDKVFKDVVVISVTCCIIHCQIYFHLQQIFKTIDREINLF